MTVVPVRLITALLVGHASITQWTAGTPAAEIMHRQVVMYVSLLAYYKNTFPLGG